MTRNEAAYHQRLIIVINAVALVLGIGSYILRLYARTISKAKFWYDDYLMGVGLVSQQAMVPSPFWAVLNQNSHDILSFLLLFLVSATMLVRKSSLLIFTQFQPWKLTKILRSSLWVWSTYVRCFCRTPKVIHDCENG